MRFYSVSLMLLLVAGPHKAQQNAADYTPRFVGVGMRI
jgi:hypothetical protein